MKSLQQILFKRYGMVFFVLFFLTLVFYLGSFSVQLLEWRASVEYVDESKEQAQSVDAESEINNSPAEVPSLELFSNDFGREPWMSQYFVEPTGLMRLLMMGIVFLLLFYDRRSGFDGFLYASRFSKRTIARKKIFILGAGVLTVFIAAKCFFWGMVFLNVDGQYMNLPWSIFLKQQLASLVVSGVYFAISIFAGFLIGELLTGLVTIYFIYATFYSVILAMEEIFLTMTGRRWWEDESMMETFRLMDSDIFYFRTLPIGMILAIFVCTFLLLWGAQKFSLAVSLENDHSYLLLPQMRLGGMVSMAVYLILLQVEVGLFQSSLMQLVHGECSLPYFLGNLLKVAFMGILCSYLLIFRKHLWQGFRKTIFVK